MEGIAMEEKSDNSILSTKKLKLSKSNNDIEVNKLFGYRLINFVAVFSILSETLACKQCGTNVTFTEENKYGLGFRLVITCEKCGKICINSCPLINGTYEVNHRIVFVMRLFGIGLNGIIKFCAFMDLPWMILRINYESIVSNILVATEFVRTKSIKKAAEDEKKISIKKGQMNGITVSGDTSWRKRFSSIYGLITLTGSFTGKIVDVLVKSKYCRPCKTCTKRNDTAEYQEWGGSYLEHCQPNYVKLAGKIGANAIIEMFSRSEDLHNVKYVNYIGNGDSQTFKEILDVELYRNVKVCKKECINQVQKRMDTRLRELKRNMESVIGGKGKLSDKLIDELTVYYGLSIRRNLDSTEKMRNDIWATLYYKLSTDEVPQHCECPDGADSWCSWQEAKLKALESSHEYQFQTFLSQTIFDAVKPLYEDLSRDDLLNRCLGGSILNNNENFNSIVWSIARPQKTSLSGKKVIEIATNIATCIFNDGLSRLMEVMQILQLTVGYNCYKFCVEADTHHIKAAERLLTDATCAASTSFRSEQDEENINVEGQLYGAGIAE